jgi:DNA-directed RNA polymerase subunit RPC12/RpoP
VAIFTDGQRKRFFPCPICGDALDVRLTKKSKPYVVCHGCGVQLFVRAQPGIEKFDKLVADAEARNIWERLRRGGAPLPEAVPRVRKEVLGGGIATLRAFATARVTGGVCMQALHFNAPRSSVTSL